MSAATAALRRQAKAQAARAREATAARDDAIRALRAEGVPLREVAELVGLSHTAVAKIASR